MYPLPWDPLFSSDLALFSLTCLGLVVVFELAQVATRGNLAAFNTIVGCPSFYIFFNPERCVLPKHMRFHSKEI